MRVKHAFIGLAPAVRMDSPGFPLAVLAGIQVSAGGGGERLRERCVHAVVTEIRDQRSRCLLLRVSSGQPALNSATARAGISVVFMNVVFIVF